MVNLPETYTRAVVRAFHEEELGRKVEDWELKHWYGDKRVPEEEPS